jgi:hypothetical protein
MSLVRAAVLRPGDWVEFDGGEHQVVALAGTTVRLRSHEGAEQVVLVTHLMSSAGFAVIGTDPVTEVEPFGLLDSLPSEALTAAREWERHVLEVETGPPPDAGPGAVCRAGFDPAVTTVGQRAAVKAAELGVSVRTVHSRRARCGRQGLWGLIDQRAAREHAVTGRADARVVAAVREALAAETNTSTGTRSRLMRRVTKKLDHDYGPGVVPLPSRTTFYRLVDTLDTGRHTFGSAITRRQTANRPQGMFTPSFAARPSRRLGGSADEHDPGHRAIAHWMLYDSHHPPSRPDKTFPDTRDHGAMRRTQPSPLSLQRTNRSAGWFKLNRRGGSAILYHRHLKPVISRPWATPMDGITATIIASGSTIEFGPTMAMPVNLGVI